jgi:hypothetical protein
VPVCLPDSNHIDFEDNKYDGIATGFVVNNGTIDPAALRKSTLTIPLYGDTTCESKLDNPKYFFDPKTQICGMLNEPTLKKDGVSGSKYLNRIYSFLSHVPYFQD